MSSFGWVPLASVWPWARCVEAMTSPSSSAADPHGDRLLADRDVEEPRQFAARKRSLDLLLEAPDEQHLAEELAAAFSESAPFLSTLATGASVGSASQAMHAQPWGRDHAAPEPTPPPHQGCPALPSSECERWLALATQKLGSITRRGTTAIGACPSPSNTGSSVTPSRRLGRRALRLERGRREPGRARRIDAHGIPAGAGRRPGPLLRPRQRRPAGAGVA